MMRATPRESIPRKSAVARTSAAWAASYLGTPKCRNMRLLKSRNASMGKTLVSTSAMFAFSMRLRRQSLPAGFGAKRNQEQTDRKGDGGKSNRYSERLKMLNAGANQKSDPGSAKSRKGRGESEGAGATFGGILLRQPQGVNRKIRATKTEKEKANKEPRKSRRAKIEDLSKRERDEDCHHGKIKCESAAPAEFFREPGHREATENGSESDEHGCSGRELRSLWPDSPGGLRERRHRRRDVHGAGPEAADRSQHIQRV